jgi:hypothetical protein
MDNNFSKILDIFKSLDEGNQFAGQAVGQKPGMHWHGTDAGTPGKKLVGEQECEQPMSLSDKLRARWEETKRAKGIQEYGAPNTASAGGGATQDPQQSATDLAQATQTSQKNLSALKQAGVNISTGIPQATQAAAKMATNPTAIPSAQDKKVDMELGSELGQLAAKVDPGKFAQVVSAIKQAKQQGGVE